MVAEQLPFFSNLVLGFTDLSGLAASVGHTPQPRGTMTTQKPQEPCNDSCPASAQVRRLQAAEQRDIARARVRRLTVGTTTFAVAIAAVGAVALSAPHTGSSFAAGGSTATSAGKQTGTSILAGSGKGTHPVARTGGS